MDIAQFGRPRELGLIFDLAQLHLSALQARGILLTNTFRPLTSGQEPATCDHCTSDRVFWQSRVHQYAVNTSLSLRFRGILCSRLVKAKYDFQS
jgi:hypothetical protein